MKKDQFSNQAPICENSKNYVSIRVESANIEKISRLIKLTELNPSYVEHHYNLGAAYYESGQYENAIKPFIRACELDRNNAKLYINLSAAQYCLKDYLGAIVSIKKAIKINPDEQANWLRLSNIMLSYSKETCSERYELIKQTMLCYAKAGDAGYTKIIEFCNDWPSDLSGLDKGLEYNSKYLFLSSSFSAGGRSSFVPTTSLLPALEVLAYKNFKSGDFLKAFTAFEHFLQIRNTKKLDLFATAEQSVIMLLTMQNDDFNTLFKESSLAKNVNLKKNVQFFDQPRLDNLKENKNITDYLKFKIKQYHEESAKLLPKYIEEIQNSLSMKNIEGIFIEGILDIMLSYFVSVDLLKSVKEPILILEQITEIYSLVPLDEDVESAITCYGEIINN